jgi:hypothetical protein
LSYLQCPQCRLTVPAAAYYLRGDDCPRCLSPMEKRANFRPARDPGELRAPLAITAARTSSEASRPSAS